MNLCIKTIKSQEKNAAISFPTEWYSHKPFPFATGDQVNVLIDRRIRSKSLPSQSKTCIERFGCCRQ